jgi:hypothetical protein
MIHCPPSFQHSKADVDSDVGNLVLQWMPHQPTSPSATSLMDHGVKRHLNATPLFTPAAAIFLRISMAYVENFPLKSFCSVIFELCGPIWGQRHLRRQAPANHATDTIRSSFTSFVQALVAGWRRCPLPPRLTPRYRVWNPLNMVGQ